MWSNLGFILLAIFFLTQAGQAQNLLSWPESMIYDESHHRYLISNYQTGDIVQIDSSGTQSYFVQGGNAIQGLEIVGNVVYVGAGQMVRGFDLESGEMVMDVSVPGVSNLNDVTADTSGNLYVSDVFGTKIIKLRISDQTYSVYVDGEGINQPNGIFYDKSHNRILVCSYRANSPIQAINLADASVTTLVNTSISNCDGITKDSYGNCFVTSWATNSIYLFDSTFGASPRSIYHNSCGPADISYDKKHGRLAIPLQSCNSWDLLPVTPSSGPYWGQTPPGSAPVRFPPVVLLSDGIWWWHGSPLFSVDGTEMYFVKYISTTDRMEMYFMEINQEGEWSFPQRPSFASDSNDNSPVFADEGNRLLFTSYREGVTRIYQVSRTDSGWSDPQLVDMDYQSLPGRLGWFFSITKDGTIYFEIFESADQNIYRSRLVNGQYSTFEKLPDNINSTYGELRPYIDPDEQYLIFASNKPSGYGSYDLYISFTNTDGSWTFAQNLGSWINGTQAEDMAFVTPDGKYFFFITAKPGDLGYNPYWVDAYFIEGLRPDTTDSSYAERIAFYSGRSGNSEIYTMNTDGSNLVRLTWNSAQDVCPAYSQDGTKIAFVSNRDGNYEIYVMNGDGTNLQRLTNTPNDEDQPAWSPDGTKIFYTKEMGGGNAAICLMNTDGSGDTTLTSGLVRDERPNVSPDGTKIVFNSTRDGNYEIYFMNVNGSNQQRLTYTDIWEVFPAWSPDGEKIAYAFIDFQMHTGEIHVMNTDGSGDTNVTNAGVISENPCWSPDGEHIAFQTSRDGNFEVYRMKSDGSGQRRLTNSTAFDGWPSWGRKCILGDANSDGNIDVSDIIYLINYLFKGGPLPIPLLAGDSNNDEEVTVSDIIYLINYLFKSGPRPICP